MKKTGIALIVIVSLVLMLMAGCKGETLTTTVNTTTTLTKTTTVTQTTATTVTVTSTVTSTASATQTTTPATTAPTTTTSSPTTTAAEVIAESADGKLQVVSAELIRPTIAMYQVVGKVLNTSTEVLSARITIGFLADGGLDQTQFTVVSDIQPGQQKTFTVSSIDTFNNVNDFTIIVETWS
jgi:hypothetical protein